MQAVTFTFQFSKRLFGFLLLCYVCAGSVIITIPLTVIVKTLVGLVIVLDAYRVLSHYVLYRSDSSVIKLWQTSRGQWGFEQRNGYCAVGQLRNTTYCSPWFSVVQVQTLSRTIGILIPADALTLREYRLLSTRIRFF